MRQARAEGQCPVRERAAGLGGQCGQAALMMLAVVGALLAGAVVLFAFGNALGAKGRDQRAADLAAISAAQVMRDLYPRLFEPPFIEPDVPNPRHIEESEYRALAVAAAVGGARRNGVRIQAGDVGFGGDDFAPTRVTVTVRGEARVQLRGDAGGAARVGRRVRASSGPAAVASIPIRARATAELLPDAGGGLPDHASGGGYTGPLAYRQGKPMRPDVALAFDRLAAAARREAGLFISVSSGFRSDAEQAALFAAHPDPKWVSRRPARASTATPRSSTWGHPRRMPGWRRTRRASASRCAIRGSRGTRGCH
jgi:hypothetical protein